MIIGLDGTTLLGGKTGIGNLTENLFNALADLKKAHHFKIFSNTGIHWTNSLPKISVCCRGNFPIRFIWMQCILPYLIYKEKLDIFHFTNYLAPLMCPCPYIITISDMTIFTVPDFHTFRRRILHQSLLSILAKRSKAITTISEYSKQDIIKILKVPPEKITVIYLAPHPIFKPIYNADELLRVRKKYLLPDKFILHVGTLEPRKNLVRLIQAFHELKMESETPHKLVLVGNKGWHFQPVFNTISKLNLSHEIIITEYVPLNDLPAIYSLADILAYPSLYEGFGLPVAEAMATGTPVVTSNTTSLPEVAGDAAVLIDPASIDSIKEGLKLLLNNENVRMSLMEKGLKRVKEFSWEKAAKETIYLYEKVYESFS